MPYNIFKHEDEYCVYKIDNDNNPIGKTLGCHKTRKEAADQIVAIKISEEEQDGDMEVLEHYGVKGMRWGVRRKRTSSGDYIRTKGLRGRRVRELSNKQLERVNRRMNLERQYKSLNPTKADRGKKYISEVLANAGKTVLTTAVVAGLTRLGKAAFETLKRR